MVEHELLVRTVNAAKEAREQGFDNTADAFDEIVESLLNLINLSSQFEVENRTHSQHEITHIN